MERLLKNSEGHILNGTNGFIKYEVGTFYRNNNVQRNITDYLRGKELKNGQMESVYHSDDEGVILQGEVQQCFKRLNRESGWAAKSGYNWKYEYHIKDHLGNVRVTFVDDNNNGIIAGPELRSRNDYYSFGMEWNGSWTQRDTISAENRYKYNGKELVEEMGLNRLDYGFRGLDSALGRWFSIDRESASAPGLTPYRYGFNNPISFIDMFGLYERKNGGWHTDNPDEISRLITMLQVENSLYGGASIGQIDKFISEEYAGSGGKLSDGSVMLTEINAVGNGSDATFSNREISRTKAEISKYGSYSQNHDNMVSPFSFYSYRYYRERSYDGSFGGLSIGGFAADMASHAFFNNASWIAVGGGKFGGNLYSAGFYSNQYVSPAYRTNAKLLSNSLTLVGKGISIYGAISTINSYNQGKLSKFGGAYIFSTDLGGIFGNIYGSALSFGTSIGMGIVESETYFNAVHKKARIW